MKETLAIGDLVDHREADRSIIEFEIRTGSRHRRCGVDCADQDRALKSSTSEHISATASSRAPAPSFKLFVPSIVVLDRSIYLIVRVISRVLWIFIRVRRDAASLQLCVVFLGHGTCFNPLPAFILWYIEQQIRHPTSTQYIEQQIDHFSFLFCLSMLVCCKEIVNCFL